MSADLQDALEICIDISERARAMKLGLVKYPVESVEALCFALRNRQHARLRLVPNQPKEPGDV